MGFVNAQHHDSAITSHKRRFTAGKVFCALSAYPSLAPTLAATKLQCLQSFAFSRIVGITQGAAFQISFSRSAVGLLGRMGMKKAERRRIDAF